MRTPSFFPALVLAGSIAGAALLTADDTTSGGQRSGQKPAQELVTPVAGPSWLNHLNIKYEATNLGRGAGRYGPSPSESPTATPGSSPFVAGKPVQLTGADLYRLNCQACHRAEGTGAPPEVKSVLDLVLGSSIESIRQQLQKEGKTADAAAIRKQAAQARSDLYRRIREGGQRMPPLAHLQETDIDALYGYLTELAKAQKTARPSQRTATWVRLGEHVVKGTCHICHDAVGPRPTSEAMLQGVIPSLAVLVADNPQVTFISKARSGALLEIGRPSFHYRGRMPVFFYLQDAELAAAYDFLVAYPPQATTKQH